MHKLNNIINRVRQSLNELENKNCDIKNLIELEETLQSFARESHDEAFNLTKDLMPKK